ncbi:hypothetical protein J2R99_000464 [Rhodopseudomonas julia]|uniref:DUF1284 domain-containing protein n=1 Tax=Rhodopseudomonas julia TaxID=200617 RepID=A0ABU0C280_9BRAD|nr:DUF1284 domain-containing protein [Rhodopseudomonas julia]MDQ0324615.1 hypothetical protein [Rhodopseudomonas julia]
MTAPVDRENRAKESSEGEGLERVGAGARAGSGDAGAGDAGVVELRAHHLLCMLTFAGKGYSPGFVARFEEVAAAINAGAAVKIVDGPDPLCACVIAAEKEPHCFKASVSERDRKAARDVGDKLGMTVKAGTVIPLSHTRVDEMRAWFQKGTTRPACAGCEWDTLCTRLADGGFEGCRVRGR